MKAEPTMSVAERFELTRNFFGLFQKEMAQRLDVSLRMYSDYATGKLPPSPAVLLKLAEEGFDINWLLTGKPARIFGSAEGGWTSSFPAPDKDAWLLDEQFMTELLAGIAACYADIGKSPSPAELASSIAQIVGDIATVSNSAEQRDAALKLALIQFRRQIAG